MASGNTQELPDLSNLTKQLAFKRQVLLNSIAEKREQEKTHHDKEEKERQIPSAIYDLTRLGYSFERILIESGIDETFLKKTYEQIGLPVMKTTPKSTGNVLDNKKCAPAQADEENITADVTKVDSVQTPPDQTDERLRSTPNGGSTVVPSGDIKRRRIQRQTVKRFKRPAWLDNLVIDLLTSEDEDDEAGFESENIVNISSPVTELSKTQKEDTSQSVETDFNINAAVGKIMMRLKVETSRLKQVINSGKRFSMTDATAKSLDDKKRTMIADIESLFQLIDTTDNSGLRIKPDITRRDLTSPEIIGKESSLSNCAPLGVVTTTNANVESGRTLKRSHSATQKILHTIVSSKSDIVSESNTHNDKKRAADSLDGSPIKTRNPSEVCDQSPDNIENILGTSSAQAT